MKNSSSLEITADLIGRLKNEYFYMITESKLYHIESLAKRADVFIKAQPEGDTFKNWRTVCWSVGLTCALSLLSSIGNPFCPINYIIHLSILITCGLFGLILNHSIKRRETIEKRIFYDSYLEEIKELLESLRKDNGVL